MIANYRLLSPALFALAVVPCAANAQDSDAIVVTATRAEQPADQTGQAITVIDHDLIERRQSQTVSDLLSTTPGVTFNRNGGIGTATGISIRGAETAQTLVLIDGVRINDPSSPGGAFDFGNLLIGNINRIEVLRGANSVPWGSQAIGGVVNIVTTPPTDDLSINARAEYGYADTAQGVANASFRAGPVAASFGGGYFRTDGISAAAIGTERDGYRNYGANGRVEIALSDAIAVDLRGYYSRGRTELDGFLPDFSFADTDEYSIARELLGYAGVRASLLDGRFNNRLGFTITDIDRDNYNPAFGDEPSFIGRGRVERFEYQGDFAVSEAIRTVFGAETEKSRFGDGFAKYSTGIDSVYGQLILTPIAPLTVTGGIRYDDHEDYGSEVIFSGNAALRVASGTLLRASYAEGFKAPTLYQLRSDFGNEMLKAERAKSYDIGIEQHLMDDKVMASATLFRRTAKDQIDFISCDAPFEGICTDRPYGTYDNIARARAQGVELAVDLKPVDVLTVNASYTYVDTENRSPDSFNFGNVLARRPKNSISLSADYAPAEGLSVGATIQHVSDSFDDPGNFTRLDGYALVGLRAAWAFNPRYELYGRVDNLFDETYQTVATYGTIGRAAYVGVRAKF